MKIDSTERFSEETVEGFFKDVKERQSNETENHAMNHSNELIHLINDCYFGLDNNPGLPVGGDCSKWIRNALLTAYRQGKVGIELNLIIPDV